MKRQLFVTDLVFEIVSVECLTKIRRAVKLLYDVIADTIRYIQVKMRAASLQLARTHTRFMHCARASRATRL